MVSSSGRGMSWSSHLPVVTVPKADTPKPVTFVYPYYLNQQFLCQQIVSWLNYPERLRQFLSAIIVDDGSPVPASLSGMVLPFPIRLFRIDDDIPWNWIAARNIGMHAAADGWCLMTDMDHVVPVEAATELVFGQHDPSVAYGFSRVEHTGEVVNPHSASWFLTRDLFWKVGGYDERYAGHYGSDGLYRRRLAAAAPLHILSNRLVRHEYQGDSSTTTYARKHPADTARVKAISQSLPKNAKPKTFTFAFHEVVH